MTQHQVTVGRTTLVASALWMASLGLLAYITFIDTHLVVATWAAVLAAAAATLSVRCFLVQQTEQMRNAYEIGRDARELGVVRLRQLSSS